jgi:hypothetical protein
VRPASAVATRADAPEPRSLVRTLSQPRRSGVLPATSVSRQHRLGLSQRPGSRGRRSPRGGPATRGCRHPAPAAPLRVATAVDHRRCGEDIAKRTGTAALARSALVKTGVGVRVRARNVRIHAHASRPERVAAASCMGAKCLMEPRLSANHLDKAAWRRHCVDVWDCDWSTPEGSAPASVVERYEQ